LLVAKPRRPYAWSPELRNAGILKRYWRLRLKEASCPNADYHETIMRLQDAVQQHDPKFLLPHHHQALSIPEIRQHLNAATRQLHQTQKASIDNRFRAYQDLLAVYQSDQDADTQKESQRKAKIVKRTIRHEKIRQMFRNIRVTVRRASEPAVGDSSIKSPSNTYGRLWSRQFQRISRLYRSVKPKRNCMGYCIGPRVNRTTFVEL
jgi:hypothetical protein